MLGSRAIVTSAWLAVPDPRRGASDQAVADAQAARVEVEKLSRGAARSGSR